MQNLNRYFLVGTLFTALLSVGHVYGQTAPQIGYLFPAGAQQGTSVDVTIGGKYMPGPCQVWIGGKGLSSKSKRQKGS